MLQQSNRCRWRGIFSERHLVLNASFQIKSARFLRLADVRSLCGIGKHALGVAVRCKFYK